MAVDLLSIWAKNAKVVPREYVYPADQRPQLDVPICKEIPIIDLSQPHQPKLAKEILKALDEYSIFRVINHGLPEKVMEDAMEVYKDFFNLPLEDKEEYVSSDGISMSKGTWLFTGDGNTRGRRQRVWKDSLGHVSYPLEHTIHFCPEKPARYREVIGEYVNGTREISRKIFELICEGLGIEKGYFAGELTGEHILTANYYPKCPDPSVTWGAVEHYDPNVLTIIQEDVSGLQILKDGKWFNVQTLPNAFFVLTCMQLQIISNGKFKSLLHRVITNGKTDRISISTFINSSIETNIEPAKAIVSGNGFNPPKYKAQIHSEYLENFRRKIIEGESAAAAGKSSLASFLL